MSTTLTALQELKAAFHDNYTTSIYNHLAEVVYKISDINNIEPFIKTTADFAGVKIWCVVSVKLARYKVVDVADTYVYIEIDKISGTLRKTQFDYFISAVIALSCHGGINIGVSDKITSDDENLRNSLENYGFKSYLDSGTQERTWIYNVEENIA